MKPLVHRTLAHGNQAPSPPGTSPSQAPIARAGLVDALRKGGSGQRRLGPSWKGEAGAKLGGRTRYRSGLFMDWALIRHVQPTLLVPIAGECPALRLLYSYMAKGTVVKKCTRSC